MIKMIILFPLYLGDNQRFGAVSHRVSQARQLATVPGDRVVTPTQVVEGADQFDNKMRTAAIMLAQLYQEQQKDSESLSSHFRSRSLVRKPEYKHSVKRSNSISSPQTVAKELSSTSLNDFEAIRTRVLQEMTASEAERVQKLHENGAEEPHSELLPIGEEEDLQKGQFHQDQEDPSASVFLEPFSKKKERIREASPYGTHPNWNLYSVIVKSGADLRQEQLALQLITEIQKCWEIFEIPIWVYCFRMLITSVDSGLVEVIPDSISVHSIKKQGYVKRLNQPGIMFTLYDHFVQV